MKRIKHALSFNETQFMSVSVFTIANLAAVSEKENAPVWLWLFAALLWPAVAFIANYLSGEQIQ